MALAFATRYPALSVLVAITIATAIIHLGSVVLGATVAAVIPADVISIVAGLAFFAFAGVLFWAFSTARPMFRKRGEVYGDVTGRLTEGFSGIRIVKAYTAEEHEEKVFGEGARKLLNLIIGTMRTISTAGAMTTFLVGAVGAVVMYVGGHQVIAHIADPRTGMSPGDLIAFTLYLGLVVGPVVQIVSIGTQLSEAFAGPTQ
jgi:subfamily B ATP-binding cassette protein MsbA